MMLRCLWCWMKADSSGGFVKIRGDAQGVFAAFIKRSAKSPLFNNILKEVSLHLAQHLCSLEALHLWSEQNEHADLLSRLADPKGPGELSETVDSTWEWKIVSASVMTRPIKGHSGLGWTPRGTPQGVCDMAVRVTDDVESSIS